VFHLKKNAIANNKIITANPKTSVEIDFENHLPLPFTDRRACDRRFTDRRACDRKKIKKITILIPCYNEEKGLGNVIDGVPLKKLVYFGYKTEIIVINNNSSDNTIKIAREKGVKIVSEKKQGKGNALKTGFRNVSNDTDYVLMLDGDNTYKSEEIFRLIEPLENGFCDVILGSRLEGKINDRSFSLFNRIGNWLFTFFIRRFYFANITDTCTGYFAWKKKVVDELAPHIKSSGFAIEVEMITKMAKLGYKMYSVPITYDRREGHSKLSPILDGAKIICMLFKNLTWKPSFSNDDSKIEKRYLKNLVKK